MQTAATRKLDAMIGVIMEQNPTADTQINAMLSDEAPLAWDVLFEGAEPTDIDELNRQSEVLTDKLRETYAMAEEDDPIVDCAYCGHEVIKSDVPETGDDKGWAEVAPMHADDCEWVATRAHRVNV